ncbi:hypothetical protein B0H34DRAFT_17861 [Crassisporium funariophilum]|nr:hypothetical protein B0H34DRAFT_17861 [Crassisporium funariophilum]
MSEDDRAAKAARAKALLKKRQQKKAAETSAAGSSVASPVSPPRTFSPAPSEHPEVNGRDLGDVFSKDTSDTSWLTSLPRVASPPPPQPPHATVTTPPHVAGISRPAAAGSAESPPHRSTSISATKPLQDKIESLSKENADLVAEVNRLQSYETAAQQALASLEAERSRVEKLQESYQSLQDDTEIALQNERQTVSLLVTEKTHLSAELQKRESFESRSGRPS